MRLTFFTLLLLSGLSLSLADNPFDTPRKTIQYFLNYTEGDNYDPAKAGECFFPNEEHDLGKKAIQLKQILQGNGVFLSASQFPNIKEYRDSIQVKNLVVLHSQFPHLYLEKVGAEWKISNESLKKIAALHEETYPLGTAFLLNKLSGFGSTKFLGLYVWQLIGLFGLVLFCFLIHKLLTILFDLILLKLFKKWGYGKLGKKYLAPLAKPISLFCVVLFLKISFPVLQFPSIIAEYSYLVLRAAVPLLLTILLFRLVNFLSMYLDKLAEKTESTLDDQLVPLIRKALKAFIIIIGGMLILQNLNIDITTLLAGISIGGLALALAAQDTVKNFFGSVMIFLDKPFQIGDWIQGDGLDGSVEEVGLRTTRVRTFYNSLISIPNGNLADMTIDNYGRREYRRYKTSLGLTYDTKPEAIELFVEGLKKIVENHPNTRKDYYHIYLTEFGATSLNILFYIFFEVPDWGGELKAKQEVNLKIMQLANHLGVRFAFPTQTLHVEEFPDKTSMTPTPISKEEMKKRLDDFQ